MPETITPNPSPVLSHRNPGYRPEDQEERHKLVNDVCDVLHLKKAPRKVLLYYSDIDDDTKVSYAKTQEETGIVHVERGTKPLEKVGLIGHTHFSRIIIDWERIHIFATYINPDKAAKVTENATAKQIVPDRNMSIMAELKARNSCNISQDVTYDTIEDMSEAELEDVLRHYMYIDKIEVSAEQREFERVHAKFQANRQQFMEDAGTDDMIPF